MKKVVTLLLLWLSVFPVFAEEYKTVTCYEAGGLDKILSEEELKTITHLKLVGNINHLDLYYVGQANVVQALDIEETRVNMISGCFCRNSSLKEIRLPETCYSIVNSFKESAIQKINLDGVTSEIYSSFVSCPQLKEIGKIAAKTTYDSFKNCAIETLEISDNVTVIGAYSFVDCPSLCSLQFPEQVTEIGENSFTNCASLRRVQLPDRLTKIGEKSFSGCESLDEISMMSNVVPTLGTEGNWVSCFDNATRVACRLYVPIGSREKYSEAWRFKRVVEVDNLSAGDTLRWDIEYTDLHVETPGTLSSKLTSESLIQAKGFRITGTLNKDDLTVLNNLSNTAFLRVLDLRECRMEGDSVPSSAFSGSGISEIYLPESITKIGSRAFAGSVVIPASVDTIRQSTFLWCKNLSQVTLPQGLKRIEESAFTGCSLLQNITLPETVELGDYAFSGTGFRVFIVPEANENVPRGLLEGCDNLEVVYLLSGVKKVGYSFLEDCVNLKKVYLQAPVPPETEVYEDYRYGRNGYYLYATYAPFTNVPKSCMLYVPQESYYEYWTKGGLWKESFTLEGMDFSGIEQAENGFRIITEGGNGLTVCLDCAMPVVVYDLQGRLVAQMNGVAGDNRLPLDKGAYIVCCGTNRVKVLCR